MLDVLGFTNSAPALRMGAGQSVLGVSKNPVLAATPCWPCHAVNYRHSGFQKEDATVSFSAPMHAFADSVSLGHGGRPLRSRCGSRRQSSD